MPHVLSWLRTSRLPGVVVDDPLVLADLREEAKFFLCDRLVEACNSLLSHLRELCQPRAAPLVPFIGRAHTREGEGTFDPYAWRTGDDTDGVLIPSTLMSDRNHWRWACRIISAPSGGTRV